MSDVTRILERVEKGDPKAAEELLPLVYDELRKLAAHQMANEPAGHTLQPTALGHNFVVSFVEFVGFQPISRKGTDKAYDKVQGVAALGDNYPNSQTCRLDTRSSLEAR